MTRLSLPKELQGLTRTEWDLLVSECALDEETELIARMYIFRRMPQNLIADMLQEHGIYISRPKVTRRWREFIERAVENRKS